MIIQILLKPSHHHFKTTFFHMSVSYPSRNHPLRNKGPTIFLVYLISMHHYLICMTEIQI